MFQSVFLDTYSSNPDPDPAKNSIRIQIQIKPESGSGTRSETLVEIMLVSLLEVMFFINTGIF